MEDLQLPLLNINSQDQALLISKLPTIASALGPKRTRTYLIPQIISALNIIDENNLKSLINKLQQFPLLIGGDSFLNDLFEIFLNLCSFEASEIRKEAVEAVKQIVNNSDQRAEQLFLFIENLLVQETWSSKCAAAELSLFCYLRVKPDKKEELKEIFTNLLTDDSFLVRKYSAECLVKHVEIFDKNVIELEIAPIFQHLAQDETDIVKVYSIDLAAILLKYISDESFQRKVIEVIKDFSKQETIPIKINLAKNLSSIQKYTNKEILQVFVDLSNDSESLIRNEIAKSCFEYCQAYKINQKESFEESFEQDLFPVISSLFKDENEEVRLAMSLNLAMFGKILSLDCFVKEILPFIQDIFQEADSWDLHQNVLQHIDKLPDQLNLIEHLPNISQVLSTIFKWSHLQWRARKKLTVSLSYLVKDLEEDYFNYHFKNLLFALLKDKVFAVRVTATLILPLLGKHFGFEWFMKNILPFLTSMSEDNYLQQHIFLYSINEIILTCSQKPMRCLDCFLELFTNSDDNLKAALRRKLAVLKYLLTKIKLVPLVKELFQSGASVEIKESKSFYLEEDEAAIEALYSDFYSITEENINEKFTYLEGVLLIIYKILKTLRNLSKASTINIREATQVTISIIDKFLKELEQELEGTFFKMQLQLLDHPSFQLIQTEINKILEECVEEESTDFSKEEFETSSKEEILEPPSSFKTGNALNVIEEIEENENELSCKEINTSEENSKLDVKEEKSSYTEIKEENKIQPNNKIEKKSEENPNDLNNNQVQNTDPTETINTNTTSIKKKTDSEKPKRSTVKNISEDKKTKKKKPKAKPTENLKPDCNQLKLKPESDQISSEENNTESETNPNPKQKLTKKIKKTSSKEKSEKKKVKKASEPKNSENDANDPKNKLNEAKITSNTELKHNDTNPTLSIETGQDQNDQNAIFFKPVKNLINLYNNRIDKQILINIDQTESDI